MQRAYQTKPFSDYYKLVKKGKDRDSVEFERSRRASVSKAEEMIRAIDRSKISKSVERPRNSVIPAKEVRRLSPQFKRLFSRERATRIPVAGYAGHQKGYFFGKSFRQVAMASKDQLYSIQK